MTEQLLLALKAIFVVVLYLFVWRVVRLSVRDLRGPQESMVLAPPSAERRRARRAPRRRRRTGAIRGSWCCRARSIRRARSSGSIAT